MIHSIRFVPNNYAEKKVECISKDPRWAPTPNIIRYNFFGLGIYITLSKKSRKELAETIRNFKAVYK